MDFRTRIWYWVNRSCNSGDAKQLKDLLIRAKENEMNLLEEVKLVKCKICKGKGEVECCRGHMCPGTKTCDDCDGKGVRLSEKDRAKKKLLERLMEYK